MDEFFSKKFAEIKTQFWETIKDLQSANLFNIFLFLALAIVLYIVSLLAIKILARKIKDIEDMQKPLRRFSFYLYFFLFWRQVPGDVGSFLANFSLFFLMIKSLKLIDHLIMDVWIKRYSRVEVLQIFRDVGKGIIWAIMILLLMKYLFGFSVESITVTSAVLTAAIGFAFQDTLVNLIAGFSVILEKTFKIGDIVHLKTGEVGVITQINWRTTLLENLRKQVIVVPNKELASFQLIHQNYYRCISRIFNVSVSYKHSPSRVKDIVKKYLKRFPEILKNPAAEVYLTAYKEYYIEYEIRFFLKDLMHSLTVEDRIKTGLWYLFKREGIKIPYPVQEISIHEGKDFKAQITPKLYFGSGEDVFGELNLPAFVRVEKGELSFRVGDDKAEVLKTFRQGEYLYLSEELCRALERSELVLSPIVEAVLKEINEDELDEGEPQRLKLLNEELINFVSKDYPQTLHKKSYRHKKRTFTDNLSYLLGTKSDKSSNED